MEAGGGKREGGRGRLDGGQAGIGRSCAVVLEIGIFVMCRVFSNPPSLVVRGYIAPINQSESWSY